MKNFPRANSIILRCLAFAALPIVTGCQGLDSLADHITPKEITYSAIDANFYRIGLYAKQHGTIPSSLDTLPNRDGYNDTIMDGWGRPLIYTISGDGVLTLTSYGKDGKPGGVGDDADISESYYSRHRDGTLWASENLWIAEAQIRATAPNQK